MHAQQKMISQVVDSTSVDLHYILLFHYYSVSVWHDGFPWCSPRHSTQSSWSDCFYLLHHLWHTKDHPRQTQDTIQRWWLCVNSTSVVHGHHKRVSLRTGDNEVVLIFFPDIILFFSWHLALCTRIFGMWQVDSITTKMFWFSPAMVWNCK